MFNIEKINKMKFIQDKRLRWEIIILATLYVTYAVMMICRNAVVVASPDIIKDPILGLDLAMYGKMMAYGSAGGFLGKMTLGLTVDYFGGRRMLLFTIFAVAAATVAFGMASGIFWLFFFNFLGHGLKSAGWPSMASLIDKWYTKNKHGRIWGIISTSSRMGVMFATLFFGYLLTFIEWRNLFFVAGGFGAVVIIIGYFFLKNDPSMVNLAPPSTEEEDDDHTTTDEEKVIAAKTQLDSHPLHGFTLMQTLKYFFTSQRVWYISLGVGTLTMLMDFINYIPIYLVQNLGLTTGEAGMTSTVFPAGCMVAALAGGFAYDKLSKRQHILVFGGLLLIAACSVLVLWLLPSTGLTADTSRGISMLAIFIFGVSIAPSYYIPMSVFSVAYGGPRLGLLMGLIDGIGYLCAFGFNYYGGSIAQNYGWNIFLLALLSTCLVSAVFMSRFYYLEAVAHESKGPIVPGDFDQKE